MVIVFALSKNNMIKITEGSDGESVPLPHPKVFTKIFSFFAKLSSRRRGVKNRDHENPIKHWYLTIGRRPFWGYHLLFILLLIVLGTQSAFAKQKLVREILYDPNTIAVEEKANFMANIGSYTSVVEEDPASLVLATTMENASGYYSQPIITETKVTEKPKEEAPSVADETSANRTKTITYIVENGDTLSKIGWKYGLKVATIQYQNNLKSESITPGQKLTLPPGDISSSLIAKANQSQQKTYVADSRYSQDSNDTPDESGFIRPVSGGSISRRLGAGHTGIDIALSSGSAVVAARGGTVVQASYGWNGGYGNIVTIDHGGGVKTRYAHLSGIGVSVGQSVGGGQYIGASGSTGRSTGPHLHFETIVGGRFTAPF